MDVFAVARKADGKFAILALIRAVVPISGRSVQAAMFTMLPV